MPRGRDAPPHSTPKTSYVYRYGTQYWEILILNNFVCPYLRDKYLYK